MLSFFKKKQPPTAPERSPEVKTTPDSNYIQAMKLAASSLAENKINYIVYGSGACVLHNVKYEEGQEPADIDITVKDVFQAKASLLKAAKARNFSIKAKPSSGSVQKIEITPKNGAPVSIDLTFNEEFGLINAKTTSKQDIVVTSVVETLFSLFLRERYREQRAKDVFAFNEIVSKNYEYLSSPAGVAELTQIRTDGFYTYVKEKMVLLNPERKAITENKLIETKPTSSSTSSPSANSTPNLESDSPTSPDHRLGW